MKTMRRWVILTLWLFFSVQALAQQSVNITFFDTWVEHSPADPCKFEFKVITEASGSGTVTASVDGSFQIQGSAGSVFGSLSAQATGQGDVSAQKTAAYNFPGFGILNGTSNGTHHASNGTSSDQAFSMSFINIECELFVHDPPPPCENLVAKQENSEPCRVSPIVLDLDQNGFKFAGPDSAIYYDIYGSGTPIHMHWVTAGEDDAFLVLDANQNGLVDDGSELFGNGTRMLLRDNQLAPNGFVGLGQYDQPQLGGNNDGVIDRRDDVWSQLSLWLDLDADGVSNYDEMLPLEALGFQSFEIIPRDLNLFDAWGNWLPYWATATTSDGDRDMVDVFFRIVNAETERTLAE